jgi:hypothetical protein
MEEQDDRHWSDQTMPARKDCDRTDETPQKLNRVFCFEIQDEDGRASWDDVHEELLGSELGVPAGPEASVHSRPEASVHSVGNPICLALEHGVALHRVKCLVIGHWQRHTVCARMLHAKISKETKRCNNQLLHHSLLEWMKHAKFIKETACENAWFCKESPTGDSGKSLINFVCNGCGENLFRLAVACKLLKD